MSNLTYKYKKSFIKNLKLIYDSVLDKINNIDK